MSAATANRPDLASAPVAWIEYPVADNVHIYQYTYICVTTAGYATPAADTSTLRFIGQAIVEADNTISGHTLGGITVKVVPPSVEPFCYMNAATPIATWVGEHMYFLDDNTVGLTGDTSNTICAGQCVAIVKTGSSGIVLVDTTERFLNGTAA